MRAAIIQNGLVINVTNSNTLEHPDGLEMVYSDTANIGDGYADGVFTPPAGPSIQEQRITIQTENKAACKAFILSHYSEETQRNAALGLYSAEVVTAMADHIAAIIAVEDAAWDLVEASEDPESAAKPIWPEE